MDALLQDITPVFNAFYSHRSGDVAVPEGAILSPSLSAGPLPDSPDIAAEHGERLFKRVMQKLDQPVEEVWPPLEQPDDEENRE